MKATHITLAILSMISILSGCAMLSSSYYQPPPDAIEAWKKADSTGKTIIHDLQACHYIDNMTQLTEQQFQAQTKCMYNKGYQINLTNYNAHNCYGSAPAMCRIVW